MTKEGIDEWRKAVGEEEAAKVGRRAAARGSKLHENIEHFLQNKEVSISKTSFVEMSLMKSVLPVLHRINNIRLQESRLYSDILKAAGTIDLCADFDGEPAIIDFKSARKIKDKEDIGSYFTQTSCYSLMIEERYLMHIPKLVIIIGQEFGKAQVFIEDRKNWTRQIAEVMNESKCIRKQFGW
jgi:genome maintenance exonuclease 1